MTAPTLPCPNCDGQLWSTEYAATHETVHCIDCGHTETLVLSPPPPKETTDMSTKHGRRVAIADLTPGLRITWDTWDDGRIPGTLWGLDWAKAHREGLTDDETPPSDAVGVCMDDRGGVVMFAPIGELRHYDPPVEPEAPAAGAERVTPQSLREHAAWMRVVAGNTLAAQQLEREADEIEARRKHAGRSRLSDYLAAAFCDGYYAQLEKDGAITVSLGWDGLHADEAREPWRAGARSLLTALTKLDTANAETRRQYVTDAVVEELTEAIRHTVEYVGVDTLPPEEGWSWYDALVKYAPEKAEPFRLQDRQPTEPDPDHDSVRAVLAALDTNGSGIRQRLRNLIARAVDEHTNPQVFVPLSERCAIADDVVRCVIDELRRYCAEGL